ncbi:quinolinate synthase NadA [Kocuria rhizophila]|nr:quinolinate synthase NadA [Kocuria rhizophila]
MSGANRWPSAVPVTYTNSSAALKAFCGRHGGIVRTSSNAATVLEWAFAPRAAGCSSRTSTGPQHRQGHGRAAGADAAVEPYRPLGGNSPAGLEDARVILRHGFCSAHRRLPSPRSSRPCASTPAAPWWSPRVPHGRWWTPRHSAGSTDHIRRAVAAAEPGQTFAICTLRSTWSTAWPRSTRSTPSSAGSGDLPVLHDVPHPPRIPCAGPGGARGRARGQPGERGTGGRGRGVGGPGSDMLAAVPRA